MSEFKKILLENLAKSFLKDTHQENNKIFGTLKHQEELKAELSFVGADLRLSIPLLKQHYYMSTIKDVFNVSEYLKIKGE